MLHQDVFNWLRQHWPVTIDLFASSLSHRCSVYFAPVSDPMAAGTDVMLHSWDSPTSHYTGIPPSLPPRKRTSASACWKGLQQARESRTQSQGRSNNLGPCSAKGGQRPPPCPPPHEIEPGAPRAALLPGERGWASPPQPEQCQTVRKDPQNRRPCCNFGAAPGQNWYNKQRTLRCPLDAATFSVDENDSSSSSNSRTRSAKFTSRKAIS